MSKIEQLNEKLNNMHFQSQFGDIKYHFKSMKEARDFAKKTIRSQDKALASLGINSYLDNEGLRDRHVAEIINDFN